MKKMKALVLISITFVPFLILTIPLPVKAAEGSANVYIICLPEVGGWTFPDRQYDPSATKDGVIAALKFRDDINVPWVHPMFGKFPPFFSVNYEVVTTWSKYKSVVQTQKNIIVVNTHGEITPIPSSYDRTSWVDEIAGAMLNRSVIWVHTAGYPFYYNWSEGASTKTQWGEGGFKRLMSHINMGDVTCHYDSQELEPTGRITQVATSNLGQPWPDLTSHAFMVQRGRPLKASDFKNYTMLTIWGSEDSNMTGAVIAFLKPSERSMTREGFGAYVHIGTNATFNTSPQDTGGDYWRGFAGAAAAIWCKNQGFDATEVTEEHIEEYFYTAGGFSVAPVVTSYQYSGDEAEIHINYKVYGIMKTNKSESIGDAKFILEVPSYCNVAMWKNSSKNLHHKERTTVQIDWVKVAEVGIGALLLFAPPTGALAVLAAVVGGVMVFSDMTEMTQTIHQGGIGIGNYSDKVEFFYDPVENYTEPGDGFKYGEFESVIHIELKVNLAQCGWKQWNSIPLRWYIDFRNAGDDVVVSNWVQSSIALFKTYDLPSASFTCTTFFDDFKNLDGWSREDTNDLSGYDYWGPYPWAATMHCAGVGTNSISGKPNLEAGVLGRPQYDKNMNACLTRSVNLRSYENAWLCFSFWDFIIDNGDYVVPEYYCDGRWDNITDRLWGTGCLDSFEASLPTNATKIRFRFYSNDDDVSTGATGADLKYVEIKAELPNDADSSDDAGGSIGSALYIDIGETVMNYAGYLNDDEDWYNFSITSSHISNQKRIYFKLNPPPYSIFNLTLYDKNGVQKAGPISSDQALTYVLSPTDQSGNWSIQIHFPIQGFGQYDFDVQLKPAFTLTVRTYKTTGQQFYNAKIWVDDVLYYSPVSLDVDADTYTGEADPHFTWGVNEYTFSYWKFENGSTTTNNPISIAIDSDTLLKAYYIYEYHGTCPTLFIWNGSDFAYETLLDIHASSDITVQHQIQQTIVRSGLFYKLQLRELDNFTSHIDQVKLYAVDHNEEWHNCFLASAKQNGTYVTLKLLLDDERRVDLAPAEIIDLKFLPSIPQDQTVYFIFEINGHNKKPGP